MSHNMFIALVPAFNEEKNVGSVVRSLLFHVDKVVVIDDCSNDNTYTVAQDAGATVIRHKINRGQGAAIETGHQYARLHNATYVLHFDADDQFDVKDIAPALETLQKQKADILFGSRFLQKKSNVPFFKRTVILPIARLVNKLFVSLTLSDAHNGFRILHKNALDKIVITQDRMAHASEIPALVVKHDLTYVEFPITVFYHEYGQGLAGGIQVVKDLLIGTFLQKK